MFNKVRERERGKEICSIKRNVKQKRPQKDNTIIGKDEKNKHVGRFV